MIPVKKSVVSSYFDELSDADVQSVNLLTPTEALDVWNMNFEQGAKGLHDLSSECWVISGHWDFIGDWIDAYNGVSDRKKFEDLILKRSGWAIDEPLFFVQSRQQIVALDLYDFLNCWQELLAIFDDSPILISQQQSSNLAISFVPLGKIMISISKQANKQTNNKNRQAVKSEAKPEPPESTR